jgi:hypothetical protein
MKWAYVFVLVDYNSNVLNMQLVMSLFMLKCQSKQEFMYIAYVNSNKKILA